MTVTIYHNPKCGTSRAVLAMLRERGETPVVIEYLKTPPSREKLKQLIAAMAIPVRSLLRRKEAPYAALGLGDPKRTEDEILDAMVAKPDPDRAPDRRCSEGRPALQAKREAERNHAATESAGVRRRTWRLFSTLRGPWRRCSWRRTPTLSKRRRGQQGIFFGHGVVRAVEPRTGALTLDHGDIKGCMPAMEMMFRVANLNLSRTLRPGDAIDFTIDGGKFVILEATVVRRPR